MPLISLGGYFFLVKSLTSPITATINISNVITSINVMQSPPLGGTTCHPLAGYYGIKVFRVYQYEFGV